jgi:release factor glutamine methyltransferase
LSRAIHELLARAADRLYCAGVPSPAVDATRLLGFVTGLERSELLVTRRALTEAELTQFAALLRRREQREPLQHIVHGTGFYGLELETSPAALIPRPETERLVEIALQRLQGRLRPEVLDVGTGSGAVALAIKAERPDAAVTGSDIAPAALQLARTNAARLGLDVTFIESDLLETEAAARTARRVDLLVSNPPYLPAADRLAAQPEVAFDPALALYAGPDGLDVFRRLQRQAFELLRPGAQLLLELDPRNVRLAATEAEAQGWTGSEVLRDLAERERFLLLQH